MSEPLADRLTRFTPDSSALDRDALLFNAGRASVRPSRAWMLIAAVLAVSQLVTLVLLWPRPTQSPPLLPSPPRAIQPEQTAPQPPAESEWGTLQRLLTQSPNADLPPPTPAEPLVPDAPALQVAAPLGEERPN